jgi:hypothetical protein
MSQEKVDRYKKEKQNRKKIMKKEKLQNAIRSCIFGLVGLVFVGWIGYSAYDLYDSNKTVEEVAVDYTAISDYMTDLTYAE